jgi:hypothetical protein
LEFGSLLNFDDFPLQLESFPLENRNPLNFFEEPEQNFLSFFLCIVHHEQTQSIKDASRVDFDDVPVLSLVNSRLLSEIHDEFEDAEHAFFFVSQAQLNLQIGSQGQEHFLNRRE